MLASAAVLCLTGCAASDDGDRPARRVPAAYPAPTAFAHSEGGCRVRAPDAHGGRQALHACARARAQLARLLAMPAPAGLVILDDTGETGAAGDIGDTTAGRRARRPDEPWEFAIDASEARSEHALGGGRRISALGYLTHETAHRVAVAMLYAADTTFGPDAGYGSPLPDWLDEALALLTEPEADQRARLSLLFTDQLILALPLRRFLYMAHPALAGVPAGSPVRRVFYGQSLAFALFLRERAGDAGVRALIASLRAGQTQGTALTSLPGMPPDGGALEQAWLAWLRARRDAMATGRGVSGAPIAP